MLKKHTALRYYPQYYLDTTLITIWVQPTILSGCYPHYYLDTIHITICPIPSLLCGLYLSQDLSPQFVSTDVKAPPEWPAR